jgi:hypothetical protein
MRRIPARAQALLEHVLEFRQLLMGETGDLGQYVEALVQESVMLEQETRELVHVAGMIERLVEWLSNEQSD